MCVHVDWELSTVSRLRQPRRDRAEQGTKCVQIDGSKCGGRGGDNIGGTERNKAPSACRLTVSREDVRGGDNLGATRNKEPSTCRLAENTYGFKVATTSERPIGTRHRVRAGYPHTHTHTHTHAHTRSHTHTRTHTHHTHGDMSEPVQTYNFDETNDTQKGLFFVTTEPSSP